MQRLGTAYLLPIRHFHLLRQRIVGHCSKTSDLLQLLIRNELFPMFTFADLGGGHLRLEDEAPVRKC